MWLGGFTGVVLPIVSFLGSRVAHVFMRRHGMLRFVDIEAFDRLKQTHPIPWNTEVCLALWGANLFFMGLAEVSGNRATLLIAIATLIASVTVLGVSIGREARNIIKRPSKEQTDDI